jgi:hypothetical protein
MREEKVSMKRLAVLDLTRLWKYGILNVVQFLGESSREFAFCELSFLLMKMGF